ncbi:MAG: 30S ribosomal protein S3 [Chloroflexi bacterium]|nr:30S ribosomal protein S3 [Chloroflexota bacterium]
MGHKVHPLGFRLGILRDWESKWYSEKFYKEFLQEDIKIRQAIRSWYEEAGISKIDIDRRANEATITIHTARPGIIIGRGGQRVNEMKSRLEKLVGKKVQLNIQEIQQPELDAYLVARNVADQIERRIAYRRAMRQAMFRTLQAGAKGVRIHAAGRLGGQEIARRETSHQGRVPLHTLRADIDYGFTEAHTTLGRIGVKVWIYKGDVFPKREEAELEEMPAGAAAPVAEATASTVEAVPAAIVEEKPATSEVEGEQNVTT